MSGLLISVLPAGDGTCPVVVLPGEADLTCVELGEALAAEVARKPRLITVEMSALTFVDSGALPMIVAARRVMRGGGTLVLVSPAGAVARVLELTGGE